MSVNMAEVSLKVSRQGLLRRPRAHYQTPLMLKAIDGQLPHERR